MLKYLAMLILASNSPRRKQLLALGGWNFIVFAPQISEKIHLHESPEACVTRLAQKKALAARKSLLEDNSSGFSRDQSLILAADTAVVDQNDRGEWMDILGKPANAEQARLMLLRLRGRTHRVYSGLTILRPSDNYQIRQVVVSEVPMRFYDLEEIQAYIMTGDPFDKAGAYAIQHPVFRPVQNLQGCYANVMGLPLCQIARLLSKMGYPSHKDIASECQLALAYPCKIAQQMLNDGCQREIE